jgi:hypothetical protein
MKDSMNCISVGKTASEDPVKTRWPSLPRKKYSAVLGNSLVKLGDSSVKLGRSLAKLGRSLTKLGRSLAKLKYYIT